MKKMTTLLFVLFSVLSCSKDNFSEPVSLEHSGSFAAMAPQDTITLPDGRKAILVPKTCYDTVPIVTTPSNRPIIITGSSTVAQWPDSSWVGYDVREVGRGGYSFYDMRGLNPNKRGINYDSLLALNPKEWIFQGGDNDVAYRRRLVDIQNDAKWIINKIIAKVPDIKLVFMYAKPTEPNKSVIYSTGENGWTVTEYYNRNMASWGKSTYPNNFVFIDTYAPYILWNPKRLNDAMFKDIPRVHWNAAGYAATNKLLKPHLLK